MSEFLQWPAVVSIGGAFGYIMNHGQVHIPDVISKQFSMNRFIMMKMFMPAMGTSMIIFSILGAVNPEKMTRIRSRKAVPNTLSNLVLGGSLLGAGMALGGSCPGTQFVQLGAGMSSAVVAMLGSLVGVFAYTRVRSYLPRLPFSDVVISKNVDDLIQINSGILQLVMGSIFIGLAYLLDNFIPWRPESAFGGTGFWSPMSAGICVGLLQLPAALFLEGVLGTSTSYVMGYCQILQLGPDSSLMQNIKNNCEGICSPFSSFTLSKMWQLVFVAATICGSALAEKSTQSQNQATQNLSMAFLGGVLVLLGARIAGGCTSGHGLSGTSLLYLTSWITVASMFAGGILASTIFG